LQENNGVTTATDLQRLQQNRLNYSSVSELPI